MKILTGKVQGVLPTADTCEDCTGYGVCNPDVCEGQQSILNQCVDIDLNLMLYNFVAECIENGGKSKQDFESFILKALNELEKK
jgi:hypothetical protein